MLHLAYADAEIVPFRMVDEIWRQHILDTAAYRTDGDLVLGRFLDRRRGMQAHELRAAELQVIGAHG